MSDNTNVAPKRSPINLGERVLASVKKSGAYGTRQLVGILFSKLDHPDEYGHRYIVTSEKTGTNYSCYAIRRLE